MGQKQVGEVALDMLLVMVIVLKAPLVSRGDRVAGESVTYVTPRKAVQNTFKRWIAERCVVEAGYAERGSVLYADWRRHVIKNNGWPQSQKAFSQALRDSGFGFVKKNFGTMVLGIGLRDPEKEFRDAVAAEMAAERIKDGEI